MRASTECNVVLALYLAMYAPYAQTQDPGDLNASGAGRDTRGRGARHARDWQGGIGTRQQKGPGSSQCPILEYDASAANACVSRRHRGTGGGRPSPPR